MAPKVSPNIVHVNDPPSNEQPCTIAETVLNYSKRVVIVQFQNKKRLKFRTLRQISAVSHHKEHYLNTGPAKINPCIQREISLHKRLLSINQAFWGRK